MRDPAAYLENIGEYGLTSKQGSGSVGWDEIERSWNELKGEVKRQWSKLTDETKPSEEMRAKTPICRE